MRRRAFASLALLASLVLVGCADEVAVVSDASCVMILEFDGRTYVGWKLESDELSYTYYDVDMGRRSGIPKTQPFSVRLGPAANVLVAEEARRAGRSRSAVVEELAEEAAKMRLFPGIGFRGRPRRAWVIGSGLDVWELVDLVRSYEDAEKLRESHALVSDRHLRLARSYAERFPEETEEFLEANRRPLDEVRALYPFLEIAE